jgi:WD40 domain-containing protein
VPWFEAVQRLLAAEPPSIGAVNASLGGPLEDIVARAMARDAGARYQSAAELAADLQRFLAGRQTIAAHAARPAPRAGHAFQKGEPAPALVAADADTICVATDPRGLTARSAATGQDLWTVNVGSVRALAASASRQLVAAGLALGSIELLDSRTGASRASLNAHIGPVAAIAFSADGRHLTSVGCGAVRLWDAATAQLVTTLVQHDGGAASLTLLADGRLAVAWADGRLAILTVPCEL